MKEKLLFQTATDRKLCGNEAGIVLFVYRIHLTFLVSPPDLIWRVYHFQYNARYWKQSMLGLVLGLGPRLLSPYSQALPSFMLLAGFFVCTWGEPGNKANYISHFHLMLRWSGAPSCTTVWLGLAGVTKQRSVYLQHACSVYLLSIFAACLLKYTLLLYQSRGTKSLLWGKSQSHWSLPRSRSKPKKFDLVHQTVSWQEAHMIWTSSLCRGVARSGFWKCNLCW